VRLKFNLSVAVSNLRRVLRLETCGIDVGWGVGGGGVGKREKGGGVVQGIFISSFWCGLGWECGV